MGAPPPRPDFSVVNEEGITEERERPRMALSDA
jgi:hypothetical protein